ncbi:MAG: copper amine oxidase N-terminal domain-containing protein [Peptostreptococcaceae bacterium]|nr:copper amine oxidase N-terminal domain-containing protein [Peptostreptococcaceae bacterium]
MKRFKKLLSILTASAMLLTMANATNVHADEMQPAREPMPNGTHDDLPLDGNEAMGDNNAIAVKQNQESDKPQFDTIIVPLPSPIAGKIKEFAQTAGNHGFMIEGNNITKVAIQNGKATLALANAIRQGDRVKVTYAPTDAPNEHIFFADTPMSNFELQFTAKVDQTIPINNNVPGTPIAEVGNSDTLVLASDRSFRKQENIQGIQLFMLTEEKLSLPIEELKTFVGEDGWLRIKQINGITPIGKTIKLIYTAPAGNQDALMIQGAMATAKDLSPIEGVLNSQGEITTVPKSNNDQGSNSSSQPPASPAPPSGGGGGGGGLSSAPDPKKKPNDKKQDPKQETKKEEQKTTTTQKVSTTLTIGSTGYTVMIDGQKTEKTMDTAPQIHQGRTVLPARMISELLGVQVQYNPATKTANFMLGKESVQLTLGQKFMMVNGKAMPLTADILNVNGRILLPLTDIQKAFALLGLEAKVDWDANTKSVIIEK